MNPPRFQIGQTVRVTNPHTPSWIGEIYKRMVVDETYEYWVTNAPLVFPGHPRLAWEEELEQIP